MMRVRCATCRAMIACASRARLPPGSARSRTNSAVTDGGERIAQLVREDREEAVLVPGLLAERFLRALAPCDVLDGDECHGPPDGGRCKEYVVLGPVAAERDVARGARWIAIPAVDHPVDEIKHQGALVFGDELEEPPADEVHALDAEEASAREVRVADRAIALDRQVADGGEIEELRVALKPDLDLEPRLLQLLVLHLELDVLHLQLVEQAPEMGVEAVRRVAGDSCSLI